MKYIETVEEFERLMDQDVPVFFVPQDNRLQPFTPGPRRVMTYQDGVFEAEDMNCLMQVNWALHHRMLFAGPNLYRVGLHDLTYPQFVDGLVAKPEDDMGKMVHMAMGVAGEAGELIDAVKKHWIYGKPLDLENVKEELGDLLFYATKIANLCGLTWDEIEAHNVEKLKKRYPTGYSDAAAQARADKE